MSKDIEITRITGNFKEVVDVSYFVSTRYDCRYAANRTKSYIKQNVCLKVLPRAISQNKSMKYIISLETSLIRFCVVL